MKKAGIVLCLVMMLTGLAGWSQENDVFKWKASSKRISSNQYELVFTSGGAAGWQLYAPQVLLDVPTSVINFSDTGIRTLGPLKDSGNLSKLQSPIFETEVSLYEGPVVWKQLVTISGTVPETLQDTLTFSYGKGEEYYQGAFVFSAKLE
ncbi:MAG: hypothetical protein ACXWV0_01575, partial [Flavisolibacter sp.]